MEHVCLNAFKCVAVFLLLVNVCQAKEGVRDSQILYKNSSNVVTSQSISTTTRRPLFPASRLPCSCYQRQCGCCTGIVLETFRQKACMNFTYEPDEFAIGATMTMNGKVLYKNTLSGKNPPPICIRVPRLQFIKLCVTFSNIYFASRNVHLCLDMEANWQDFTLLEWSFDCLRMGLSGFAVVPPEEGGGLPTNEVDEEDQTDEDYDDSARNTPLIVDSDVLNPHFSSNRNAQPSSGKFKTKTISTATKAISTLKVNKEIADLNGEKNDINVPIHAVISPDGDIVFTLAKV